MPRVGTEGGGGVSSEERDYGGISFGVYVSYGRAVGAALAAAILAAFLLMQVIDNI